MIMPISLKKRLQDPLYTFRWFERFLALSCITIPLILRLTDKLPEGGYNDVWRSSISDYVYMWHNYIFGMLLGSAAMLFIFNGFVYFKREEDKHPYTPDKNGKWYNIVLGVCLLGVVILPYKEHSIIHYFFAAAFFVGNALATGIFHTKGWPKSNISMAILTVVALGLHFTGWFPWLTLFWAEWVSLAVVGVHFWLESW